MRDIFDAMEWIDETFRLPQSWTETMILPFLRHPTAQCIHELAMRIGPHDEESSFVEIAFEEEWIQRESMNQWDHFDRVLDELEDRFLDCMTYSSESEQWDFHLPAWFAYHNHATVQ